MIHYISIYFKYGTAKHLLLYILLNYNTHNQMLDFLAIVVIASLTKFSP